MECNYGLFSFPPTADAGDEDECWRCSHWRLIERGQLAAANILQLANFPTSSSHGTGHCTLASSAIAKLAKQKGNIPGWNGPMLHSAKCPAAVVSTVSGAIVHRHHSDRVAGKPLFACKIFLPSRSTLDISSWDCRFNKCQGGGGGRWEIITGPKCEMRALLMLKAEHSEENCCCCGVGEQLPATAVLL